MIELRDVSHTYVTEQATQLVLTHAVTNVDLVIPSLEFVAVVGASGCGKTTLLRLIAGLMTPTSGEILVDGVPVDGPGPDRAVVFQDAALYPWRTLRDNVRLGLDLAHIARGDEARRIADRQLELVGLSQFADHYPGRVSGGMRQRAGLARALAIEPETLLMDEPFGSLDAITRRRLGAELVRIWEDDQRTVVFVTHSLDEALLLADRVLVMRAGAIVCDVPVDLPRPRHPDEAVDEPEFLDLRRRLWGLI
jgi:NitT/TauT family transport system ATP-binding protein